MLSKILSFLLLGLFFSFPTFAQEACASSGTIERQTYSSAVAQRQMFYTIYLPPCYTETTDSYPILYLLHGSNEDDGQWERMGWLDLVDEGIRSGLYPPMIIAMPFSDWLGNENQFDYYSWGNILRTEFIPYIQQNFRIASQANHPLQAIGGISRGGFWAYHVGLTLPDQFVAIGGHSAFFDRLHAPPAANPLNLIEAPTGLDKIQFWLDRGVDDFAFEGLDIMGTRMQKANLNYQYEIYPVGQHIAEYWKSHMADYMNFYSQALSGSVQVPTEQVQADQLLILPVVAFPSLQTSLNLETLQSVLAGALNPDLIIDEPTRILLWKNGFNLHPDTQTVPTAEINSRLWKERTRWTLLGLNQLDLSLRPLWINDQYAWLLPDYPLLIPTSTDANFSSDLLTTLTASGVTAISRSSLPVIDQNGLEWVSEAIAPFTNRSDFFHMSNEVSFVENCPQDNGSLLGGTNSLCSKPEYQAILVALGVDIIELTGNHNNDFGYAAYEQTYQIYQNAGYLTVGGGLNFEEASRVLELNHHGNKIAWIACNFVGPYYALVNEDEKMLGGLRPGAFPCDWAWFEQNLPGLSNQFDIVIVSVQHVEVEDYLPLERHQIDYRRLADLGADVVLGTAAHKPQTYEFYQTRREKTAIIHYGLGNFIFDQPFWGNMRFFLDTLIIYDGRLLALDVFPGIIDDLARPRLMTEEERFNFLQFMFILQNGF
ncbi:hypothetical protein MASR2M15_15150 [Anaerolineales bacterium]